MPYFLTQNDCYRLLQRLLPESVFPDGAPQDFYWTAEAYSYALNLASAYANQATIYANFFPQTCDSTAINAWEIKVFGQLNTQGLTLAQRQQLILNKLRSTHGISQPYIEAVVAFTLPPGTVFEVVCWCCGSGNGGWVLDVSQLDLETYLNYDTNFSIAVGPDLCSKSPADFGMTQADWDNLKLFAYTYEVRIYGLTLTSLQRAQLNAALDVAEPARSNHVINDGLDPSEELDDPPC